MQRDATEGHIRNAVSDLERYINEAYQILSDDSVKDREALINRIRNI